MHILQCPHPVDEYFAAAVDLGDGHVLKLCPKCQAQTFWALLRTATGPRPIDVALAVNQVAAPAEETNKRRSNMRTGFD